MSKELSYSLNNLEKSFNGSIKDVMSASKVVENDLSTIQGNALKENYSKKEILNMARIIERLSIQNDYKLNLLKDFPIYISNKK